jgi:hypothetical protein
LIYIKIDEALRSRGDRGAVDRHRICCVDRVDNLNARKALMTGLHPSCPAYEADRLGPITHSNGLHAFKSESKKK